MKQIFESDSISFVEVSESLVNDYLKTAGLSTAQQKRGAS